VEVTTQKLGVFCAASEVASLSFRSERVELAPIAARQAKKFSARRTPQ